MGHILFHQGPRFNLKIKIFTFRYILVYIHVRHKEVRCRIYIGECNVTPIALGHPYPVPQRNKIISKNNKLMTEICIEDLK